MEFTLEVVVFWILLVDAIGANLMSWTSGKMWFQKHFRLFSRYFPVTKGWTTYYLVLVLWIGVILYRAGQLTF